MPKDRAEVQDQYKIGGGSLNEFEFNRSKGETQEQAQQTPDDAPVEGLRGAAEPNAPQNIAERIRRVEQSAHEIVERRRKQEGGGRQGGGAQKAAGGARKAGGKTAGKSSKKSAKKSAQKAAKKPAGAAKKSGGSKKGAAKKGGAKKGAARKGGGPRG